MPFFDLAPRKTMIGWRNAPAWNSDGAATGANATFSIQPLMGGDWNAPAGDITAHTMALAVSANYSTSVSQAFSSTCLLGVYTRTGSTLSLLNSVSWTFGTTSANTSNSLNFHGIRLLTVASSAWSAQPSFRSDVEYWVGFAYRTNVSAGRMTWQQAGSFQTQMSGRIGAHSSLATGTQAHSFGPFAGTFSATSTAPPVSMVNSQIAGGSNNMKPLWFAMNAEYPAL